MALPFKILILLSAIIFLIVSAANDKKDIGQIFYQSRGKRFITGPMIRLKLKNYRTPSSLRVPKKVGNGNMVEEPEISNRPFDVSIIVWWIIFEFIEVGKEKWSTSSEIQIR